MNFYIKILIEIYTHFNTIKNGNLQRATKETVDREAAEDVPAHQELLDHLVNQEELER